MYIETEGGKMKIGDPVGLAIIQKDEDGYFVWFRTWEHFDAKGNPIDAPERAAKAEYVESVVIHHGWEEREIKTALDRAEELNEKLTGADKK